MWKKWSGIGFLLIVSLLLCGCGTVAVQTGDPPEQAEPSHLLSQMPPALQLQIGDDTIRTFRGGYSWSCYDPEEGLMVGIEAESNFPPSREKVARWRKVDRNADAELKFEEPPLSYEVHVWNEAGARIAYPGEFDLSKHEGKTLFEILARWEQGQASYAIVLDVE